MMIQNMLILGQAGGEEQVGMFGGVLVVVLGLAMLVVGILYLLTLQKSLNRCSPESRAMAPGLVWLMLIPLFNLVWQFFVVLNIAKSLQAEFALRGIDAEPEPGKKIGLAMCILNACGLIPVVGAFLSLGGFVCWIIYWKKIADFSARIAAPAAPVA